MEEFKKSLVYLSAAIRNAETNPKGKPSVTEIADELGVHRSTVTRALGTYQTMGYLDQNNKPTQIGKEWMDTFTQHQELLVSWLIHNGISRKTAERDALEILVNCSDNVISLLCKGGHMCKECDQFCKPAEANWFSVNGGKAISELKQYFPDGEYQAHFAIYKEQTEKSILELSMANDAFEYPAVLKIEGETGIICLKIKEMRQQSVLGIWYSGMLASLRYDEDGCICEAEIEDGVVSIPISAFRIVYELDCKTVRGMARVFMTCTAGEAAMPENAGLLEFKLWKAPR